MPPVIMKIGIYICECGPNIKDRIDIPALTEFSQKLNNVSTVKVINLLCSPTGFDSLRKDLQENKITRVVIAGCSLKEHESDFKRILQEAGVNPFLLQIANIREQCAWVFKDKAIATEKASLMIKSAVARVRHHEPLEPKQIDCLGDVLVIGAGVSGISAALSLAQKKRKVYLVERSPVIGGEAVKHEKLFIDMECASCLLENKLDQALHQEKIEVLTLSRVEEVLGFYGNFIARIERSPRFIDPVACIGCGECFKACPVEIENEYEHNLSRRKAIYIPYPGALPNIAVIDQKHCLHFTGKGCDACLKACPFGAVNYDDKPSSREINIGAIILATGFSEFNLDKAVEYGYGKLKNVYTGLEFERLLNSDGPSKGRILLKNGKVPKKIALLHCVGSRAGKYNSYCSGICCAYLGKFARLIKEKIPKAAVSEFYSDLCLPGRGYQLFFDRSLKDSKVKLVREASAGSARLIKAKEKILVEYKDACGKIKKEDFDLVVLAGAMEPDRDTAKLAGLFGIILDQEGFFAQSQPKLSPSETMIKGVFTAGCANGPKDISGSISQAQSACAGILQQLLPGEKLTLSPMTAEVQENCSGCKICVPLCPYQAIAYDDVRRRAVVNEIICAGCGICAAACPSNAIKAKHFTEYQIRAEVNGFLE
jgi:heterodisulfide reductase subunit A